MHSFRSNIDDVSVKSSHRVFLFQRLSRRAHQCAPTGYDMSSSLSCYNGTNSAEGNRLLKEYGEATKTIDLSFVPSIEIDNVSAHQNWRSKILI